MQTHMYTDVTVLRNQVHAVTGQCGPGLIIMHIYTTSPI